MAEKKVIAFRCARTGMFFPADYQEGWGKKYGVGLGPVPVSEALTNNYAMRDKAGNACLAQPRSPVVCVEVSEAEYNERKAILHCDDNDYSKRWPVMLGRQAFHRKQAA